MGYRTHKLTNYLVNIVIQPHQYHHFRGKWKVEQEVLSLQLSKKYKMWTRQTLFDIQELFLLIPTKPGPIPSRSQKPTSRKIRHDLARADIGQFTALSDDTFGRDCRAPCDRPTAGESGDTRVYSGI